MFKTRANLLAKLIGGSITLLVVSSNLSWASNDLFDNFASEMRKGVQTEFNQKLLKKLPSIATPSIELNSRDVVKQIQEGLKWFGYPAETVEGLARKKIGSAISEIQKCWKAVDPNYQVIPKIENFGSLSIDEFNFFKTHYYVTSTMKPRIYFDEYHTSGFTACEYFQAIVLEASVKGSYESLPPGQCYAEGDKADPLFYCTFSGMQKEVSVCEELDEDAESEEDSNTLSYNFGRYNSESEMSLYEKIENVFYPAESYTADNVPVDTSNEFVFSNNNTRYVITADTWMQAKGRGFDATLTVLDNDKVVAKLSCDEGSIWDNSWDGTTHEKVNKRKENSRICIGKYIGYALKNNVFSELPVADAGYSWLELMRSNPFGALYLTVNRSERASYKLEGFDRSLELTKKNETSITSGAKVFEDCFGDWCSVCDTWPGTDTIRCYTIHDVNKSGLMLAFDSVGNASIHEECYPKLSYPCSFAGRSGGRVAVKMVLLEHNGSSAKVFETGEADWTLSCK